MLTQNSEWPNHPIRLVFAVAGQDQEAKARETLARLMEAARVSATLEIVAGPDAKKTSRRWNKCGPRSEICGG
ncbi:MAG: hypothetical protein ABIU29_04295 [Chthoniobacterales bacterium]